MDFRFTQNGLAKDEHTKCSSVIFLSKSSDIDNEVLDNVIQIIDERGNEVNCTIEKFIEIFDNHGLEGFIL